MKTQITYKLAILRMMGYCKTTLDLNMVHCRTLPSNTQSYLCVGSVQAQDANLVGLISESWQGSGRQQWRGMMLQTDRQYINRTQIWVWSGWKLSSGWIGTGLDLCLLPGEYSQLSKLQLGTKREHNNQGPQDASLYPFKNQFYFKTSDNA